MREPRRELENEPERPGISLLDRHGQAAKSERGLETRPIDRIVGDKDRDSADEWYS